MFSRSRRVATVAATLVLAGCVVVDPSAVPPLTGASAAPSAAPSGTASGAPSARPSADLAGTVIPDAPAGVVLPPDDAAPSAPPEEQLPTGTIGQEGVLVPPPGKPLAYDPATPVGQAMDHLNAIRAQLGLKPVALDERLSKGAANHAEYLRLNHGHPAIEGLKAHQEDPSLPGSTPEGREPVGELISWGTPKSGIDGLIGTLYHRISLIRPEFTRIGMGAAADEKTSPVVVRFGVADGEKQPYPVMFPYDGQAEVDLHFDGELPNPLPDGVGGPVGYPVTFTEPADTKLDGFTGTLRDAAGNEVPCYFSSPTQPARAGVDQHGTVCLIPKKPLKHSTTYKVSVTGSVAGAAAKTWAWSFTTLKAIDVEAADVAAMDAADGRVAWVSGRVKYGQDGDGDAFLIFESPHKRQLTVMLSPAVWATAKASLGLTKSDQLVGTYIKVAARLYTLGETYYNIDVFDGAEVIKVADAPAPKDVDAADVAALDGALDTVAYVTGKVKYASGTDGDAFWVLDSPHGRQVTVMLSPESWAEAKAVLGLTDAKALEGKVVRQLGALGNVGATFLNVDVKDGKTISIVP